jgi:DNA polymerase-3 subunit gamma/tau
MVRFLRNVTVAKIAGKDSALLQVSADERARVGRIAELFSEEDLARHLQIMLRTHGELGYRQEQRFHLELGLLKMAHAQRLLPIEQLLSDIKPSDIRPSDLSTGSNIRTAPRPILAPTAEARRHESVPTTARSNSVSPFAADSARKGNPKAEAWGPSPANAAISPEPVIMGSAALAIEESSPAPASATQITETKLAETKITETKIAESKIAEVKAVPKQETRQETRPAANADSLRDAVLNALSNQQMLVSMLETAQWILDANTLTAKVAASSTMIEMSFTKEARGVAGAAASGLAGRPIRVQVEPGGVQQTPSTTRRPANGTARSRAEQDPVVQRMQEKFGAEIRTVIDYREKG